MRYGRHSRRSAVKTTADDDDYEFIITDRLVYDLTVEDGPEVEETGLLWPDGEPIVRYLRGPLGFLATEPEVDADE